MLNKKQKIKSNLPGAVILKVMEIKKDEKVNVFDLAYGFKKLSEKIIFYSGFHELENKEGKTIISSHDLWDDIGHLDNMGVIKLDRKNNITITEFGLRKVKQFDLDDYIKESTEIIIKHLNKKR